jgi:uncharacterized membrane protein YfbV (UPF0208 family)
MEGCETMKKPTWPGRLALAVLAVLCVAASTRAQEIPPRYKQWAIDPNYETLLNERFKANKQLGRLKDMVKQMMANPDMLPFDPDKLKDVKLEDGNLKNLVEEWVANDPNVQKSLRDWFKQNPADGKQPDMEKLQGELKTIVDDAVRKGIQRPELSPAPPGSGPLEPIAPKEDALAKIAERALKQTEKTKLGEWLRDSPAWKRAFEDLRGTIGDPNAPHWKLEGWQARLLDPEGAPWQLGEKTLAHLRNLPKPDLERFNWTLSAPGVGENHTPILGAPHLPTGPSLSTGVTWILFVLLCLLVGWRLLSWGKRKAPAAEARPDLGPWPVRPEVVATRADLVRAFDYLALWTLGLAVASWNHHAIARRWREKSPGCAETAQALALLYEQARYTAGADALTDAERALARRSLLQIAEAL